MIERRLEVSGKVHGMNHVNVVEDLNAMGLLLSLQGHYPHAQAYHRKAHQLLLQVSLTQQ